MRIPPVLAAAFALLPGCGPPPPGEDLRNGSLVETLGNPKRPINPTLQIRQDPLLPGSPAPVLPDRAPDVTLGDLVFLQPLDPPGTLDRTTGWVKQIENGPDGLSLLGPCRTGPLARVPISEPGEQMHLRLRFRADRMSYDAGVFISLGESVPDGTPHDAFQINLARAGGSGRMAFRVQIVGTWLGIGPLEAPVLEGVDLELDLAWDGTRHQIEAHLSDALGWTRIHHVFRPFDPEASPARFHWFQFSVGGQEGIQPEPEMNLLIQELSLWFGEEDTR
ncbi:MAG: hypothetical protein ACE5H3_01470 [Planctomycetota bacterium]